MSDERVVVMLPNGTWLVNDGELLFLETEDDEPVALGTVWDFAEKLFGAPIITMELGEDK